MKHIYLLVLAAIATGTSFAQNEEDALRYSTHAIGGTARNMGMAGTMSALGGDFSAVLTNPAALGRFNKNNFSFTPFIEHNTVNSHYESNASTKSRTNLKLGNISMIKSYDLNPKISPNWVSFQLGAGFNRTQSFNESFNYSGTSNTSLIDYFIAEASGTSEQYITSDFGFSSGLAYLTYAIDPVEDDNGFTTYTSNKSGYANQTRSVESEGGMGEFNFTLSGNLRNKLLLGGSLNIATLNYYTNFNHTETFNAETSYINRINYTGYLDVSGSGLNARVGAIFMPLDFIRVGAAIETPTRLSISENFGNNMSTFDDLGEYKLTGDNPPPTGSYDYVLRTPLKANFSLGLTYKKIGSISAEVQMIDHSSSKLKSVRNSGPNFYSFSDENNQIQNLYRTSYNIKLGAELRVTPSFYLRGGYAQFQSAYKPEKGILDPAKAFYTAGLGYNFGAVYIDFAGVFKKSENNYHAYLPTMEGSTAVIKRLKGQYALSFGYRF